MSESVMGSEVWTVGRLLNWIRNYLAGKGLEQPQLCAQLLLAHALGCKRLDLYLQFDRVPGEDQLALLRDLVRRSAQHEPIAYLVGHKEFFSLDFVVSPDVLIPRPETETLVEAVLATVRAAAMPPGAALDLCTGSGCLAIALAKHLPGWTFVAADSSAEALKIAEGNIARHGLADRITLRPGDLFEALADSTPFDLLVANPPYVPTGDWAGLDRTVAEYEPRSALDGGEDGLGLIRRIVAGSADRLREGASMALEVGHDQAPAVRRLFEDAGFVGVRSLRDGLGHERVVVGTRPR